MTAGLSNKPIVHIDLLNEVTALVEWPVALLAEFDPRFLSLPREVLITAMATHLKCFPVENTHNKLLPQFIVVSNIDSKNPKHIIQGNEKVLNARLSDAEFFYHNDLKIPLEKRLKQLAHVVFQKQLGTMEDKSHRLSKLATYIAKHIKVDVDISKRAALLSKCDLVSEMVVEFPKLQGTMGYYYALHDKESKKCCAAIKDFYLPRFSGDELPHSLEACAVALADRLDTLVGILGINQKPSGDKDPYGLRRAVLGILRILIEKQLPLNLTQLVKQTMQHYAVELPNEDLLNQTIEFATRRLKSWYQEQGVSSETFEAVLQCNPDTVLDFHHRIAAVQAFQKLPEAAALASANKRVSNILKKAGCHIPKQTNDALFEEDAEKQLAKQLKKRQKTVDALYQKANYTKALSELSSLKEPVDMFFDTVMIMVDDKKVRENRLALLATLHHLFTQVADISLLQ
jgi:glycyl-tRNA synthetase beta chain